MIPYDIILIALITIYLVLRLRAILGERNENDRRRRDSRFEDDMSVQSHDHEEKHPADKVVVLNVKQRAKSKVEQMEEENAQKEEVRKFSKDEAVAKELEVLVEKYKDFSVHRFMEGAEAAFGMILTAYAKADVTTLKKLLSPDMFKTFKQGVDAHKKKKQKLEFSLVGAEGKITDVTLKGAVARLSVLFNSEQVNLIKDEKDKILDGDPKNVEHCEDTWVFEKNMRSDNPLWLLVETA